MWLQGWKGGEEQRFWECSKSSAKQRSKGATSEGGQEVAAEGCKPWGVGGVGRGAEESSWSKGR